MKRFTWSSLMARYPALFALILFVIAILVNFILQPNMFAENTLNSNMRVFLPIILLTAGQAIVILGGGIDISVGGIVSIVNTILATRVGLEGSHGSDVAVCGNFSVGGRSGWGDQRLLYRLSAPAADHHDLCHQFSICRLCVIYLAQSGWWYSCPDCQYLPQHPPLGIPLAFYVIAIVLVFWMYFRSTRYGNFLFAVGGKAQAAYEICCPGDQVQFSTYVISGLMAAFSGIAITMLSGSGNADIGSAMTLNSITAVVIGGTAMSGGIGGVAGPIMGAITLGLIQNIISFAGIDHLVGDTRQGGDHRGGAGGAWDHQPVQEATMKRFSISPPVAALILAIVLFILSGLLPNGYGSDVNVAMAQATNILRLSVFLGVIAAGQTLVIISGSEGIDLSAGSVVTLTAILTYVYVSGE